LCLFVAKYDIIEFQESTTGPGLITLGQETDTLGGGYDLYESYSGQITEFQVWNYVLNSEDIETLFECNSTNTGAAVIWEYPITKNWIVRHVEILDTFEKPDFCSKQKQPIE
jgi:hypothetical protein